MLVQVALWVLIFVKFANSSDEVETVPITGAPYIVAILMKNPEDPKSRPMFLCEGSILNEEHVITYSRCGHHQMIDDMLVHAGSVSPYEGGSTHKLLKFAVYTSDAFNVAPAVIRVTPRFKFDEIRQPIALSTAQYIDFGSWLLSTTFRRKPLSDGRSEPVLRQEWSSVMDQLFCVKYVPTTQVSLWSRHSLCTIYVLAKAVDRASGTPAVYNGKLVGISRGAYRGNVGIFVDVAQFVGWIRKEAGMPEVEEEEDEA